MIVDRSKMVTPARGAASDGVASTGGVLLARRRVRWPGVRGLHFGEYLGGVLTNSRRGTSRRSRRFGQLGDRRYLSRWPDNGIVDGDQALAVHQIVMLERGGRRDDRFGGHVAVGSKDVHPFRGCAFLHASQDAIAWLLRSRRDSRSQGCPGSVRRP